jgi:hypothetical protein
MSSDLAPTSLPLPPASLGSPLPPKQREERPRELDMVASMDEGTTKTQIIKCRLYWCLIEFLKTGSTVNHIGLFDLSCKLLPLYFLSDLPHPSPLPLQYLQTVSGCGKGVGRVLSYVVDHIWQEFNTVFLTRFRTYKISTPPQTKRPLKTTFRDWCLHSSFVHDRHYWRVSRREGLQPKKTTAEITGIFQYISSATGYVGETLQEID